MGLEIYGTHRIGRFTVVPLCLRLERSECSVTQSYGPPALSLLRIQPQFTRTPSGNARDFSSFGQQPPRVTLADQFTWGAVVCAGVFIVVFVCVMAAWWVHKKQQDRIRRRVAQSEAAQRPYCIENDPRSSAMDVQRPPSYFEVIGFFDPPPSYNDILRVNSSGQLQNLPCQAYDNVAVTIDELPPPFVEEAKSESKMPSDQQSTEASAIETVPATVITVRDEATTPTTATTGPS